MGSYLYCVHALQIDFSLHLQGVNLVLNRLDLAQKLCQLRSINGYLFCLACLQGIKLLYR